MAQNDVYSERQGNVFDSLEIRHIFWQIVVIFCTALLFLVDFWGG